MSLNMVESGYKGWHLLAKEEVRYLHRIDYLVLLLLLLLMLLLHLYLLMLLLHLHYLWVLNYKHI
jgi:hypothetical protein